jgi:hypothetical protein
MCAQACRRDDLGCGTPRERDRPLLLGKAIGELRRRRNSCLEPSAAIGR